MKQYKCLGLAQTIENSRFLILNLPLEPFTFSVTISTFVPSPPCLQCFRPKNSSHVIPRHHCFYISVFLTAVDFTALNFLDLIVWAQLPCLLFPPNFSFYYLLGPCISSVYQHTLGQGSDGFSIFLRPTLKAK